MRKIPPTHRATFNQARVTATPIHKYSPKKWSSELPKIVDEARTGLDEQSFNKLLRMIRKQGEYKE